MLKITDGGAAKEGFSNIKNDCVIRALAMAAGISYKDAMNELADASEKGRGGSRDLSDGLYREDYEKVFNRHGLKWRSAPKFKGRKARYYDIEGKAILRMARHVAFLKDGVLNDKWDSRDKMVYGYWSKD